MVQLDTFIFRGARFRALFPNPSIETREFCLVSFRRWRRLERRLEFEGLCSEALSIVQMKRRYIKEAVQDTLDTHKSLLESADYPGKQDDCQRLNAAMLDLKGKSASFDSTIRRLLHIIYLPDSEAWEYSVVLSKTLFGFDNWVKWLTNASKPAHKTAPWPINPNTFNTSSMRTWNRHTWHYATRSSSSSSMLSTSPSQKWCTISSLSASSGYTTYSANQQTTTSTQPLLLTFLSDSSFCSLFLNNKVGIVFAIQQSKFENLPDVSLFTMKIILQGASQPNSLTV